MKEEAIPEIIIKTDEEGIDHWIYCVIQNWINSEVIIIESKYYTQILERVVLRLTQEFKAGNEEKRERIGNGYRVWLRRLPAIDVMKRKKEN